MLFQRYRSAVDRFTLEGVDIADAEAEATAEVRDQLLAGRVLQTFVSTAPLAAELGAFLDSCLDLHVGDLYGLTEVAPVIRDGIIARPSVIDYKLIDVPSWATSPPTSPIRAASYWSNRRTAHRAITNGPRSPPRRSMKTATTAPAM